MSIFTRFLLYPFFVIKTFLFYNSFISLIVLPFFMRTDSHVQLFIFELASAFPTNSPSLFQRVVSTSPFCTAIVYHTFCIVLSDKSYTAIIFVTNSCTKIKFKLFIFASFISANPPTFVSL